MGNESETQTQENAVQEEVGNEEATGGDATGGDSDDSESLLGTKGDGDGESTDTEVPDSYEFIMPEGRELDTEMVEKVTPLFQELKISQEGAQKLADLLVSDQEAKEAKYKEITEGWRKETIKTLGGDSEAKLSVAAKFIDRFGNDNVRQVLNDTGLGNHPEIVQMFIKAGKHFSDDSFATGTTRTNAVSDPEKAARKMFPNTKY